MDTLKIKGATWKGAHLSETSIVQQCLMLDIKGLRVHHHILLKLVIIYLLSAMGFWKIFLFPLRISFSAFACQLNPHIINVTSHHRKNWIFMPSSNHCYSGLLLFFPQIVNPSFVWKIYYSLPSIDSLSVCSMNCKYGKKLYWLWRVGREKLGT